MSQSNLGMDTLDNSTNQILELLMRLATDLISVTPENFKQKADKIFIELSQLLNFNTVSIFNYNVEDHMFTRSYFLSNLAIYEVESKYEYPKTFILKPEEITLQNIDKLNINHPLAPIFGKKVTQLLVTEPIVYEGSCRGFISFENHQTTKIWNSFELNTFKMIALLISSANLKALLNKEIAYLKEEAILVNQVKGEFLYKMSHEIRTPLSGIYNSIYLLGTTNLSIEQKDFLEIGQASADIMSSVIDGVLDISKIESGRMEIFRDAFNLEEELIRMYLFEKKISDEKGLSFNFNYDYRINHELIGDFKKLRQIILKLLNNAIKYTHQGSISLNVYLESDDNLSRIRFEISDTGIGFDQKSTKRLSQAFSLKNDFGTALLKESGLGISVTNQLVQLLGGHISIQSQVNQGSTFNVYLDFEKGYSYEYPFEHAQNALLILDESKGSMTKDLINSIGISIYTLQSIGEKHCEWIILEKEIKNEQILIELKDKYGMKNTHIVSLHQDIQKKYKSIDLYCEYPISSHSLYQKFLNISSYHKEDVSSETTYQSILSGHALIVDDNRLNRIALESILTKEGLISKSVNSGPKAIEIVQKESFDIVLMDVQMPDMDGIETTRRIRNLGEKYKALPIIAVTANIYLSDYDFMKTSQMNDIILKPIRVKSLSQILRKYIKTTSSIVIPSELFIFDQKDFELRFEGSFDIAEEVIGSFIDTYQDDLNKISSAIKMKNSNQIIDTAHYFKGSCAYLSGKRSVWILNYILSAAKNENLEFIDKSYDLLKKEVTELLKAIKVYKKKL